MQRFISDIAVLVATGPARSIIPAGLVPDLRDGSILGRPERGAGAAQ